MWLRLLPLALAVAHLVGCAPELARTARIQDDKVCVEPVKPESEINLLRISNAAGYLVCRENAFSSADQLHTDLLEIAELYLLASAEQAIGRPSEAGTSGASDAIAFVCEAAVAEMLRPESWSGAREVVVACDRWRYSGV